MSQIFQETFIITFYDLDLPQHQSIKTYKINKNTTLQDCKTWIQSKLDDNYEVYFFLENNKRYTGNLNENVFNILKIMSKRQIPFKKVLSYPRKQLQPQTQQNDLQQQINENIRVKQEKEQLELQNSQMIKEIQDLKKELQNQEKQIRDLQIKIQNLTKEHFNEKMKMNQLIQQLQLENLNKTDQLNQISMYSNQTNQTNKINKENQQLKNENQNLLTKITQLQQIQDDSKSQIFKLNDLKEDLQNQTNQFKIQLNSSEEQKRLLLITIESIKNQNNQLCFDQHDCISQINFNQIQELLIDALIKKKKVQYQSQQKQLMPLNKLKVFNTILQNYLLIIYQKQLSELIRTLRNASLPIFQCSLVNCNFVFISRDGNQSCQVDNHYFCPICEISCNFKRL